MSLFLSNSETLENCLNTLYNNTDKKVIVNFTFNERPDYFGTWEFYNFEDFKNFLPDIGTTCTDIKLTIQNN
jgi:hypothetical protein